MERIKNYNSILDFILKTLGALFKVGLFVGGILIFAYCLSIGRIPKGITIGDGLFFLWVVFCFGIIYVMVLAMLGAAGAVLSPVTAKILTCINKKANKSNKSISAPKVTLPLGLMGLVGFGLVLLAYTIGNVAFFSFIAVVIMLSIFIPMYSSLSNEFIDLKKQALSSIYQPSVEIDNEESAKNRLDHIFRGKVLVLSMMIIMPLCLLGFSSVLLQATMKMAGIKTEHAEIFVFTILLRDIGNSVIIKCESGNLSIPNKYILIGDDVANKSFKPTSLRAAA